MTRKALFRRMRRSAAASRSRQAARVQRTTRSTSGRVLGRPSCSALVDKSLVVADVDQTGQRYRLLQTIEEYARERLGGEPAAAARWRSGTRGFSRPWPRTRTGSGRRSHTTGLARSLRPDLELPRGAELGAAATQRRRFGRATRGRRHAPVPPPPLLAEAIGWSEER